MLFGDGIGFSGLFATHPPLLQRIQALEPQFRADQLDDLQRRWLASPPSGMDEDARLGLDSARVGKLPIDGAHFDVTPPMVVAQVAQPASDDYRRADAIVSAIPDELRALAARRESVMSLVLRCCSTTHPRLLHASMPRSRHAWARQWPWMPRRCMVARWSPASDAAPAPGGARVPRAALAAAPRTRCLHGHRARRGACGRPRSRCSSTAWADCCRRSCANRWTRPAMHARADASFRRAQ